MKNVLAFDFGASSGRAIKATYNGETISYSEIHRFSNIPKTVNGHICHDIDLLVRETKLAIKKAGNIDSLAFDTWGVDYGLLDINGDLLTPPVHYRDNRTKDALKRAFTKIDTNVLYEKTGNQIMNINTLFQLLCDEHIKEAKSLLFMPDLLCYLLTGVKVCEKSIASTSQMFSPLDNNWCTEILDIFGIDMHLFAPIVNCATINGRYNTIPVVTVAGHDTQCAVTAMPLSDKDTAFLSCGTWSLIGCELDRPVLTEKSNILGLSNELGANGKINYLKNISGLWLIQETRREIKKTDREYSFNELEQLARKSVPFKCFIDPDADDFAESGNLIEKIDNFCYKTNQYIPQSIGEIVRCIYESLVLKYRYALEQIEECTDKKFKNLSILGGGTKDSFLCQLTCDCINKNVTAGPVEATALGNIILQLIALGEISDVDEGRRLISKTESVKLYIPSHGKEWDEAYTQFQKILRD